MSTIEPRVARHPRIRQRSKSLAWTYDESTKTNSDRATWGRQTPHVTDPGKRIYNPSGSRHNQRRLRSRLNQPQSRTRLNQPRLVQLAGPRRPKRVPLVIQAPLPGEADS